MPEQILISAIRTDGGTQPRTNLSTDVVTEYCEAMQRGDVFPPVELFYDGSDYWLVDGFHRVTAADRTSLTHIAANITPGTLQDAQWHSLTVNQTHGLRRTTADKQRAIEAALIHPKSVGMSDNAIAAHLGVSQPTVSRWRKELEASYKINKIENREVTRNGVTYTQNTANIGSKPAPVPYDGFDDEDDDFDPDATIDDDDEPENPIAVTITTSESPFKAIELMTYTSAFCDKCGQSRSWKLTERIGVNLLGVCQECRTVSLRTPRQWADARNKAAVVSLSEPTHERKIDDMPPAQPVSNRAYKNSSESNEWYTPADMLFRAKQLMGAIDLDPASSSVANITVGASVYYTIENSGLIVPWLVDGKPSRVWLNPPYGNAVGEWVDKLLSEYSIGNVQEALFLVAARTDTQWFRKLREFSRCFLWGRISFVNGVTGEAGDPAGFPSMLVHLPNKEVGDASFVRAFSDIGDVYQWEP